MMVQAYHALVLAAANPNPNPPAPSIPGLKVTPTLGNIGGSNLSTLGTIIGVIWVLLMIACIGFLAKSFLQFAAARQQGYTEKVTESAKDIKHALGGLVGIGALPAIVLAVGAITGTHIVNIFGS